jgi:hypothetical protein
MKWVFSWKLLREQSQACATRIIIYYYILFPTAPGRTTRSIQSEDVKNNRAPVR